MKTDQSITSLSYENIYNNYYRKVLNYVNTLVGMNYAEDITQETFIKIYKKLNQLRDESKLSSWIFKIALNTTRDKMRKESKMKTTSIEKKIYHEDNEEVREINLCQIPEDKSFPQEEKLIKKEMIDCYINFVRKLPVNYYTVYILSEFEDLSNNEISKRLSITLETVKIRLHRARNILFQEIRTHCRCYQNDRGELLGELKN